MEVFYYPELLQHELRQGTKSLGKPNATCQWSRREAGRIIVLHDVGMKMRPDCICSAENASSCLS